MPHAYGCAYCSELLRIFRISVQQDLVCSRSCNELCCFLCSCYAPHVKPGLPGLAAQGFLYSISFAAAQVCLIASWSLGLIAIGTTLQTLQLNRLNCVSPHMVLNIRARQGNARSTSQTRQHNRKMNIGNSSIQCTAQPLWQQNTMHYKLICETSTARPEELSC